MLHDLWLLSLYFLLEINELSWQSVLPFFLIILYIEPYPIMDLIAEVLLIEVWQSQQHLWALDNHMMRHMRAMLTLAALLIVQQRFAIYDRSIVVIVWTLFCLYTLSKIILRFYRTGQLLYLNSLSVQ